MDDPRLTILDLLETNWDSAGLGYTPKFSAGWYDKKSEPDQITIIHISTDKRHVFLSDDVTTTDRRCEGRYAIDVWTILNEARKWSMHEEVSRIIKANCNAPGGDLEFADISNFIELDELETNRKILRSRATLTVLYWS